MKRSAIRVPNQFPPPTLCSTSISAFADKALSRPGAPALNNAQRDIRVALALSGTARLFCCAGPGRPAVRPNTGRPTMALRLAKLGDLGLRAIASLSLARSGGYFCPCGVRLFNITNSLDQITTVKLPGKWRRGRDSNPRGVSAHLISSQRRCDRFGTSPEGPDYNSKHLFSHTNTCVTSSSCCTSL